LVNDIRQIQSTDATENEVQRLSIFHSLPAVIIRDSLQVCRNTDYESTLQKHRIKSAFTLDSPRATVNVNERKNLQSPFHVFRSAPFFESCASLRLVPESHPTQDLSNFVIVDNRWYSKDLGCFYYKIHPVSCQNYIFVDAKDETKIVSIDGSIEGWMAEKTDLQLVLTLGSVCI